MKRSLVISFILFMGLVSSFTSCGTGNIGGTVKGETFKTQGWTDNNTFRLATSGVPKSTLKNRVARRESAKRAAILNAQYQILEKFKGSKIDGAAGSKDFENTGIAVSQEVSGILKGGSVQQATYDDEDNCEIVYEVKAKGLKKLIRAEFE